MSASPARLWRETACLGLVGRYRVLLAWLRSAFSTPVCCHRVGRLERLLLPTTEADEPVFNCRHTPNDSGYVWANKCWTYQAHLTEITPYVPDL